MSNLQQQLVQYSYDIGLILIINCSWKLWRRLCIDQKSGPCLLLRVSWWIFSLGRKKINFTNYCLRFKTSSCSVEINWFGAMESVKLVQISFLQKFGCYICLFSSSSLYIFTLLMNESLIATVKLSGVTSQQSLLPRPAGILFAFCSWLVETASAKHK